MRNHSCEKNVILIVFLFGLSLVLFRALGKVQISALIDKVQLPMLRGSQDQWGRVEVLRMELLQAIGHVHDKGNNE